MFTLSHHKHLALPALIALLALLIILPAHTLARDLYWPAECKPGTDQCIEKILFPDTDGNGVANNCEAPGYSNHRGTDINAVKSAVDDGIDVLMAADGVVKWVFDGKHDQCPSSHADCQAPPAGWAEPGQSNGYRVCSDDNNRCPNGAMGCFYCFDGGNVVVVEHPDSNDIFATRYYHMKRNSITVSPGQRVSAGQKIGEIGSAGDSRWPHLHFEVSDDNHRNVVDPWAGNCGPTQSNRYWKYNTPWIAPARKLPGDRWRQISLPAVAPDAQASVNDLFGDDISGSYGSSWFVYRFDTANNQYELLSLSSRLRSGEGYWMKHENASVHELDMPAASSGATRVNDNRCATGANRCARTELLATRQAVQWHMVGNPFSQPVKVANIRVVAEEGTCNSGCTLAQASNANLVHNQLFALGDGPAYDVLQSSSDLLPAWQGAWMATLPGASDRPSISLLWAEN